MQELKENEKRALEKLKEMAKKKNPIEVSLRSFRFNIRTREWFFRWKYRKASHMAVRDIFNNLQKKGYITLDYSDTNKPKVIVNKL